MSIEKLEKTKEAIEFVDCIVRELLIDEVRFKYEARKNVNKKVDKVIEVLKRGEKYEAIFNEVKEKCGNSYIEPIEGEVKFNDAIKIIEQKYFPKPRKSATNKLFDELEKMFFNGIVKIIDENRNTIEEILDIIPKRGD